MKWQLNHGFVVMTDLEPSNAELRAALFLAHYA